MKIGSTFRYSVLVLLGIIAIGLSQCEILTKMIEGPNLDERIIRTLKSKSTQRQQDVATFSVPLGYGPSNDSDKSVISLTVSYPDRKYPTKPRNGPIAFNQVTVLIRSGGGQTIGDNIKIEIDNARLESGRFESQVIGAGNGYYVIRRLRPGSQAHDGEAYIFFDSERRHWVQIKWNYPLKAGEGVGKDQSFNVYYRYDERAESDPVTCIYG